MNDNKQSSQSRFLIAAVLSMIVLLSWSYFFTPKKPDNANANINGNVAVNSNTAPAPVSPQPQETPKTEAIVHEDNTPNKTITIKTPLYAAKFDSKGAVATSWILSKNVSQHGGEKPLWAEGSTKENKIPLELISQDNPKREFPFRLSTGDSAADGILNDMNFTVSHEGEINLAAGQSQQVDFTLRSGDLEVVKSFIFHADSNLTDLKVTAKRNGQTIENLKLLIGTAIGDQGVKVHNYYLVEPEAVSFANGYVDRHVAASVIPSGKNDGKISVNGDIDWAGVGDTYFGMAAIPAQKTSGLEFTGTKIKRTVEPFYNGIFAWITRSQTSEVDVHLITAHVPITADGSATKIYTGSKDYFTLKDYDARLESETGRPVYLGEFINYSWYAWFRAIIKPIAIGLLYCLTAIYGVAGNYGIAIIIFTLIFYSVFFPLRWYSSKSFKKAQSNAPKMKELQEKMKDMQKKGVALDDPRMRELQMEQLKMTKDAIPIGGCLPLLLQMPLFLAFFVAITIGLDFRQASFLWLGDLSGADPYHILEFLFAASMAGTMIFTPTAPAITDEQKMQQKMMTYMMPALMLWVMWGYPAGMLLYWFFGNIVSFGQQFIINRLNADPVPAKTV
jgi:YidC/Oxa1 family membrane protein insertase